VVANYIQLKLNDEKKDATVYIDESPKATGNIVGFINSRQLVTINKKPNCIFEGHEGNCVFICAIKSISTV